MSRTHSLNELVHHFVLDNAAKRPDATAVVHGRRILNYAHLGEAIEACGRGFLALGLAPSERVAVYLPKCPETVTALFGAAAAGGVFVPINPLLKPRQVAYILRDCNVRVLVTAGDRIDLLQNELAECHDLRSLVLIDPPAQGVEELAHLTIASWANLISLGANQPLGHRRIDSDMAAILYTSGSTGRPKGVVLSHRNLIAGAQSVAHYLGNNPNDRLLAILPLSFDAGFSQLTTAFSAGASVALMEYLLPKDVIKNVVRERITGITAVPPLWIQLAPLTWPPEAVDSLRYIANTGGRMPKAVTATLRRSLPQTKVFLMYGLTEAFRSTYLPPEEVDKRPDSIGKAIPNAEILVVREDGSLCAPGEPGELVHRGPLVAMGYWNAPEKTSERFRPAPGQPAELPLTEIAVWSGDTVRMDEEGFLYFVTRQDEMIKTSGYRVSPTEVEEVLYETGLISEVAVVGAPHPKLGQGIIAVVKPNQADFDPEHLLSACRAELPNFMVPLTVITSNALPRNTNGKIDRRALAAEFESLFKEQSAP
ncbi:acyl-CoA ligase (AMP-forming), exosortase system type 1 associated [Nitrosococcus halophilus Nc 4]|uniref:Acyl-CoA ligase (AMP-forming), exosortase system type 1 associated n=1 Tax=Nitrosococcus halophilus (strain Nc4) TaxID=472759 RepID=D5C541_NITHN|nr:acyl-CoA ligase (AMP-forming), exosortase A system-associated [Nitrosococcus halophilus]ADE15264.1 acyl-CoA ligase (AMP-forming), exosortase system type 1 associated [Nitrosococcus halophilus Nc 4]